MALDAIHDLQRRMNDAPTRLAHAAAEAMAHGIEAQLLRDTNGTRRLRNLDRSSLSTTTDVHDGTADISAVGSGWAILEHGTTAHQVAAARQRQSRALKVEGVGWRVGPVRIRGSRPKHTFTVGTRESVDAAFQAQQTEWGRLHGS